MSVGGDNKGADIQGGLRLGGHPVGVHADQRFDGLHKQILGHGGDAQTLAGVVHAAGVVIGAEKLHTAIGGAVGLHALKNLLRVVEHHGGGVQLQRSIGNDTGVVPAFAGLVIKQEHMVGKIFAEPQRLGVGLGLKLSRFGDFDFHGKGLLLSNHCNSLKFSVIIPV